MAEWSAVSISSVESNHGRIDAEFFRPEYLQIDRAVSSLDYKKLGILAKKIDVGHVGSMVSQYCQSGVKLLQTQQVREFFLDMSNCIEIKRDFHNKLKKSQVRKGDVLIARSGSFGVASIYLENEVINSADIIILEIDRSTIDPLYLVAFLNSKYGSLQLKRFASGGVQGHVNLRILGDLKVPLLQSEIQRKISSSIAEAYTLKKLANSSYQQAQSLLESELSLDKLTFDKPVSYATRFSECITNGRIDAAYFQPKYQQIRSLIESYPGGYDRLLSYCDALSPNFDPKKHPKEIFRYIELANIEASVGLVEGFTEELGRNLPSRAKRIVSRGDIIASSVVGSVEKSALVTDEDGYLASTGFFHLRPKIVAPEFLLVLVRSLSVRMQLQQQATGGILSAVPDQRLRHIIVPKIPKALQDEITALVQKAHDARKESKRLLEQAKRRVEELIKEAIAA